MTTLHPQQTLTVTRPARAKLGSLQPSAPTTVSTQLFGVEQVGGDELAREAWGRNASIALRLWDDLCTATFQHGDEVSVTWLSRTLRLIVADVWPYSTEDQHQEIVAVDRLTLSEGAI